jgi:hypothetical protein
MCDRTVTISSSQQTVQCNNTHLHQCTSIYITRGHHTAFIVECVGRRQGVRVPRSDPFPGRPLVSIVVVQLLHLRTRIIWWRTIKEVKPTLMRLPITKIEHNHSSGASPNDLQPYHLILLHLHHGLWVQLGVHVLNQDNADTMHSIVVY